MQGNSVLDGSQGGTQNLVPLHVFIPSGLSNGTQITLSTTSTAAGEVDVWNSAIPTPGSTPLIGGPAGDSNNTSSVTWTVGSDTIPTTLYVGATAGSQTVGDITFTLTVTPPGATTGVSASTQPATAVKIDLLTQNVPNGGNVGDNWAGKTENWLVGQMVNLQASVEAPAAWKNNLSYTWSVPGNSQQAYSLTTGGSSASITPMSQSGQYGTLTQQVQFFWDSTSANTDTDQVGLTVGNINGQSFSSSTTFDVSAPIVQPTNLVPITGNVQLGIAPVGIPSLGILAGDWILEAGTGSPQAFNLSASVNLPNGFTADANTAWTFLQTLDTNDIISQNNIYYTWSFNGPNYLDTRFPPATINDPNGQPDATGILPVGSGTYTFFDTPSSDLSANNYVLPGIGNSVIGSMQRNDSYTAFIMFRPPGNNSQWVAIKAVSWDWAAHVNKGPGPNNTTIWTMVGNPTQPTAGAVLNPQYEPEFSNIWGNGQWQSA